MPQAIELTDVQAKLGNLMLQIMGYEKRIAELEAENAELRARDQKEGPAPVAAFPTAVPEDIRRARGELDGEAS